MFRLPVALILPIALALAGGSFAWGQGPDVQVTELRCGDEPERVVIENLGDAAQDLAGWQLQSDPSDSEVFDLSVLGSLQPGASITIQSGPSTFGTLSWGKEFIFRDDDSTDYAQIVDDAETVVHQVDCAGGTAPEPSPTPSPEASPPAEVPEGGGPPPPNVNALSSVVLILIGGSVAAAGMGMVAIARLRRRD